MTRVTSFRITFTVLLVSIVKNEASVNQKRNILKLLSNVNVKTPYIAVLYSQGKNIKENDNLKTDLDLADDLTPGIDSLDPPHDRKVYLLYHLLRTTEEREQIDPEAARNFEQTKDILRQVLRKRCRKLNSCYQGCPKKWHIKCTIECQETYDDYDICQTTEKKCNKSKCGKTKPPAWHRRQ